ncbi:hypothetical protein NONI108955_44515 [Nocardia ninae]
MGGVAKGKRAGDMSSCYFSLGMADDGIGVNAH